MSLSYRSKKASLDPSEQSGQNRADDIELSTSALSQPGSSTVPRYEDGLRHKQPFRASDRTGALGSTPSHLLGRDSQFGSLQANSRSGFFAGASNVNASHGVFNDIAGDYIINVGTKDYEILLLDKLPHVKGAGYRSENHDTCLDGTRTEELRRIEDWEADVENKRVYWLNGMAGTGKSTIAKTFAERSSAKNKLGASFFCSRDFDNRRSINLIFPTLAYHLACRYPEYRAALVAILNTTPDIGHDSLAMQLENLLVRPLQSTMLSTTIVIDALDECMDKHPVSVILRMLGRQINALPRVKFFITGRPEIPIRVGFRIPLLRPHTEVFVLHEVDQASIDQDIELYLRIHLTEIAAQRSDCDVDVVWPTDEEISVLVTKCSGVFIVASIIVKFIGSPIHKPELRLGIIISRPDSTVDEGKSGVDLTYDLVFSQSFEDVGTDDTDFFDQLRLVIGSIAMAFEPLSCTDLAAILGVPPKSVRSTVRSLHSVLVVPESDSAPLKVCHKSFPDYLTDPTRCTDRRFHIDPSIYHCEFGMRCLALMNKALKKNICDLPAHSMNNEISDLRERREKYIGRGLEYACGSWARHLFMASGDGGDIRYVVELLETFFKHKLLAWLEVLSIVGDLQCAVYSLRDVKAWLVNVDLSDADLSAIVNDSERFVVRFFDVIESSALHAYRSALPWCPRTSLVRQLYQNDIPKNVNLLNSFDKSWDACTRVIEIRQEAGSITYSNRDALIAVCMDKCVEIFEVSTGQRQATLTMNQDEPTSAEFSPDNTLVVIGCRSGIVHVWDLQTGSLVGVLEGHTEQVASVAFSPCGTMIASGSADRTIRIWNVPSYDCQCVLEGHSDKVRTVRWLAGGRGVVSGSEDKPVRVWDIVGKKCLETRIEHDAAVTAIACSSDSSLIASGSSVGTVKIHNAQTGDLLRTIFTRSLITSVRFQTRDRVMYTTKDSKFAIWDLTENENELLFEYDGYGQAISSDGKSVASSSGRFIKLWQTDISDHRRGQDSHAQGVTCVGFSGDGQLVASGSWDATVKIWNAITGLCLHTFRDRFSWVGCVTFSPDSRFCASASEYDMIRVWDVHTGTLFSTIDTYSNVIRFSPDGSQLLSLLSSYRLTLWEVETGKLLAETKLEGHFRLNIAFGADATSVVLQSFHTVMRWQISPAPSFNYSSLPLVFIPIHDEHQSTSLAVAPCQYDYDEDGGWISDRQGRQVLWIPPDRRGKGDCCGEKVVIGSPSGKVTFVDLSDLNVECRI